MTASLSVVTAEFIPALRNIAIPDQIPNWTLQTATNELQNRTNQRRNSYWELVPDIDALFGKLWSSHAVEAMRVYDHVLQGAPPGELPETVLTKTKELWKVVFPGRTITFTDFTAKVTNDYLGATTYTAKHMSDGERTGLYLAGRVFDSQHSLVVVDEPETHFHSRLGQLLGVSGRPDSRVMEMLSDSNWPTTACCQASWADVRPSGSFVKT